MPRTLVSCFGCDGEHGLLAPVGKACMQIYLAAFTLCTTACDALRLSKRWSLSCGGDAHGFRLLRVSSIEAQKQLHHSCPTRHLRLPPVVCRIERLVESKSKHVAVTASLPAYFGAGWFSFGPVGWQLAQLAFIIELKT